MLLTVGYNYLYVCVVKVLDAGMGRRKWQLLLVYVGEESSYSWQRVEAQDEEVYIFEEAILGASDDETQPPGT